MDRNPSQRQNASIGLVPFGAVTISDLLRKYNTQAPRYTSYPSVAQFAGFDEKEFIGAVNKTQSDAPLSVYVHIPFCGAACCYCTRSKLIGDDRQAIREYLTHLRKEMALLRLQSQLAARPVQQLYLGGGTPSFLDDGELTELVHIISYYFNLSQDRDRDFAIEIDPRTVDSSRIELVRGLGFNRVSLGVQDFDADVLEAVNRQQDIGQLRTLVQDIRARALGSLNFDMIYGLPKQTIKGLGQTLQRLLEFSPERITYYNYSHLPARFVGHAAFKEADLPSLESKLAMSQMIVERLTSAGYEHIGMDQFVKRSDPLAQAQERGGLCRNFQGYSLNKAEDLLGIGLSAISYIGGVYAQNAARLESYYASLDENRLPISRGLIASPEDVLRRDIIQQLCCCKRVDIAALERTYQLKFREHFAEQIPLLEQFARDGLLNVFDERRLVLSPEGCLLVANVCMVFDEYLSAKDTIAWGECAP